MKHTTCVWRIALAALAALVGASLTPAIAEAPADWPQAWSKTAQASHPLVGRIWDTRRRRFTDPADLVAHLANSPPRILGEVHDNGDHHRLQAWLIGSVVARTASTTPRPAVVFEQIRAGQQAALDTVLALPSRERTSERVFDALAWDDSGWPPRDVYRPLIDVALAAGLALVAGDVDRATIRGVARGGLAAMPAAEQQRLGLPRDLPDPELALLIDDLVASHCGLMPRTAMAGMAAAQQVRDAHLARALADAAARHGSAFLIAGNEHARGDRGVPWHLKALAPTLKLTTVLIQEADAGRTEPTAYSAAAVTPADAPVVADFLVWTAPATREDPCTKLHEQFRSGRR